MFNPSESIQARASLQAIPHRSVNPTPPPSQLISTPPAQSNSSNQIPNDQNRLQDRPASAFSPQDTQVARTFRSEPANEPGYLTRGAITRQVQSLLRSPEGRERLIAAERALHQLPDPPSPEGLRQNPDLAWLSNSFSPDLQASELGQITRELRTLINPVVNLLRSPNADPAETFQHLLTLTREGDQMRLLPLLESENLLPAASLAAVRNLRENLLTNRSDSGAMDYLMALSINTNRSISSDDARGAGERSGPMDRIRSRLLISSQRAPQELNELAPLLERIQQNPQAELSESETQLLNSFGIQATENGLSGGSGHETIPFSPTDISTLRTDLNMLSQPSSPAAATYVRALEHASQATNNYANAVAEFESLHQQRSEIIQRRNASIAEKDQVVGIIDRLDIGNGSLSPADTALLERIDPKLSFDRVEGESLQIRLDGQTISTTQLRDHLQNTSLVLDQKIVEDNAALVTVEQKIVVQRSVVAQAEAELIEARQEAERAYQAMSPDEQARYADQHQAFMRQSGRVLAQGRDAMRRFDAELGHLPGYAAAAHLSRSAASLTHAESSSAIALETDSAPPLAAQPAGDTQSLINQQEKASQEASLRELSRNQIAQAEQLKRSDASFVNRILALKRELAEEEFAYQQTRREHYEQLDKQVSPQP